MPVDIFEYRLSIRKNRETNETTVFYPAPSGFGDGVWLSYTSDTQMGFDIGQFGVDPMKFYRVALRRIAMKPSVVGKKAVTL